MARIRKPMRPAPAGSKAFRSPDPRYPRNPRSKRYGNFSKHWKNYSSGDGTLRRIGLIVFFLTAAACFGQAPTADVFAAYARQVPEAQRVTDAKALPGIYWDNNPDGVRMTGEGLYLFPDGGFAYTRWLEIQDEKLYCTGSWAFADNTIALTPAPGQPQARLLLDKQYVPILFKDERREKLVLMGAKFGFAWFQKWIQENAEALQQARLVYAAAPRARDDFIPIQRSEELVYLSIFSGTFARKDVLNEQNAEAVKAGLAGKDRKPEF